MIKLLPLVAATALFVGAGYWHGVWIDRWSPSYDYQKGVARFEHIPQSVGDWEGSEVNLGASDLGWDEQQGFLRRYTHRITRESVVVAVWYGPTGFIGVHTPLTCYQKLGYAVPSAPEKGTVPAFVPARKAEFARAQFSKLDGPVPSHLRFWWAWSATGDWLAPEQTRFVFSSHRALYKLYVMQDLALAESTEVDPCPVFLNAFLPALNQALFDIPSPVSH